MGVRITLRLKPRPKHGIAKAMRNARKKRPTCDSGVCRICQCTDDDCRSCIIATGQACHWADPKRTICSRCWAMMEPRNQVNRIEAIVSEILAYNHSAADDLHEALLSIHAISLGKPEEWRPA